MVLGIETSGKLCSIAWYKDEQILLEYNVERDHIHSTILADLFNTGMQYLEKSTTDITLAAIGSGPGSYTGLRIGMSFLKGLCYGADIPIIGVSNFEVLALQACFENSDFITLINANKGKYYFATFDNNNEDMTEKGVANLEELKKISKNYLGLIYDGKFNVEEKEHLIKHFNWITVGYFNASFICKAGINKFNKFGADNINELEPMYLQAFAGIL